MFGREIDLWISVVTLIAGVILGILVVFEMNSDFDTKAVPPASIPDAWVQPSEFFVG